MNKAEIICYILSAYFLGISTGCCISNIIHNSIYKHKRVKPLSRSFGARLRRRFRHPRPGELLKNIDEMHDLPVKRVERPVGRFCGTTTTFINPDEVLTPEHERALLQTCGSHIVDEMIDAGAFAFRTFPGSRLGTTQLIDARAVLEVVMPIKTEDKEADKCK